MPSLFNESELADLIAKVALGERLDFSDGVRMMKSQDILALGHMANIIRERKNDKNTYFDANVININFRDLKKTIDTINDFNSINIIGELNSDLSFNEYLKVLKELRQIAPKKVIRAFTTTDIDYFVTESGLSILEVIRNLIEAGLNTFSIEKVDFLSGNTSVNNSDLGKTEDQWFKTHSIAHKLGMNTTASLVYGKPKTADELTSYLLKLRDLQDSYHGFQAFIPIPSYSKDATNQLASISTTGFDDLRMLAVSRILLDNFDHITTSWTLLGPKLAQVSLEFGVDMFIATLVNDSISAFSAMENSIMTYAELAKMIKKAGKIPIEWGNISKL